MKIIEGILNMQLDAELRKTTRNSRRIGFDTDEMSRCGDFLVYSIVKFFDNIDDETKELFQQMGDSNDMLLAYRMICTGIAKVIQPVQVQPRSFPPRLECKEIISAVDFTRRMLGIIKSENVDPSTISAASLCLANLHQLEDDWLENGNDSGATDLVWFDVMCFKHDVDDAGGGDGSVSHMNLLATLSFIKKKFNLCHLSCVVHCNDILYLIAPACESVIVSKCLIPYLHLIVPLHRPQLSKSAFMSTPLIINTLAAAPPRSLMLKWGMFMAFSLLHRQQADALDFMFPELVTNGCAVRAEAGRWRLLELCDRYNALQRAHDHELDPNHMMTEDYIDCEDECTESDGDMCDVARFDDDVTDVETDADDTLRRDGIIARHKKQLAELMCRIRDMTRIADLSISWGIATSDLNLIASLGDSSSEAPRILRELNDNVFGTERNTIVTIQKFMKSCVTTVPVNALGQAFVQEDAQGSPSSVSLDTCSTSSQSSMKSVHSIRTSPLELQVAAIPKNVSTLFLCEIAHHPNISRQLACLNVAAHVTPSLLRNNVHEQLINDRLDNDRFEYTVTKVARKEYSVLYSPKTSKTRSKAMSQATFERTQRAFGAMKRVAIPDGLSAQTDDAMRRRFVHRTPKARLQLDCDEQAFHESVGQRWTYLERTLFEYEEVLRGFRPGSHCLQGIHEFRKVKIHTKRRTVYKKRRTMPQDRHFEAGSNLGCACKQVELCVAKGMSGFDLFPICAKTGMSTETVQHLARTDHLRVLAAAYGHALQPGMHAFPGIDDSYTPRHSNTGP